MMRQTENDRVNVIQFIYRVWQIKVIPCRFLPRDASAERGDATVSRLSACLSVRPSVRDT